MLCAYPCEQETPVKLGYLFHSFPPQTQEILRVEDCVLCQRACFALKCQHFVAHPGNAGIKPFLQIILE